MSRREYRIVLVRETGLDAEIEKTMFQRSTFSVLSARDGFEAVTLANAAQPDLVILAFKMRDLSGPDACAALKARKETRDIPVLIVSDEESERAKELSSLAGADATVPRSLGLDHMMKLVAQMLRIPSRRPVRMTVIFTVGKDAESKKESLGRAVNLSEGGMGLEVGHPLDVDTDVQLRFVLPGESEKIRAAARVRWIDKRDREIYLVGVEFTEVPRTDRERLNRYLDRSLSPN